MERWGVKFLCLQGLPSVKICVFPPASQNPPRKPRSRITRAEALPLLICNFPLPQQGAWLPPSAISVCIAPFQVTCAEVSELLVTTPWKELHNIKPTVYIRSILPLVYRFHSFPKVKGSAPFTPSPTMSCFHIFLIQLDSVTLCIPSCNTPTF